MGPNGVFRNEMWAVAKIHISLKSISFLSPLISKRLSPAFAILRIFTLFSKGSVPCVSVSQSRLNFPLRLYNSGVKAAWKTSLLLFNRLLSFCCMGQALKIYVVIKMRCISTSHTSIPTCSLNQPHSAHVRQPPFWQPTCNMTDAKSLSHYWAGVSLQHAPSPSVCHNEKTSHLLHCKSPL